MTRSRNKTIRSRRLATAVVAGAAALTGVAGTSPAQAGPAVPAPVGFVTLRSWEPTSVSYMWAGASGFQWEPRTSAGSGTWVDYPGFVPPAHAGPDDLATGTDVVGTWDGGAKVTQRHRSTGVTATVTIPAGQTYKATSGWSVLTQDASGTPHVLRAAADGSTTDLPVTGLPAGARPTGYVPGGSVRRAAIVYTLDGTTSVGLVDLGDGTFRTYVTGVAADPPVRFNDRWLVADWRYIRVDAAPGTQPTGMTPWGAELVAVVGDQLLTGNPTFVQGGTRPALTARSLTTGETRTVLANSSGGMGPTPDGGALATAGTSSLDWNVHRITPTADGGTATEKVAQIPADRIRAEGLAMAGGELFLDGRQGNGHLISSFALDAAGVPVGPQTRRSPALADPTCLPGDAACPQLEALGDGHVVHLFTDSSGREYVIETGLDTASLQNVQTGDHGGRIAGATGRYVLYNGGTPGVQKIVDFPRGATSGRVALSRSRTTAALWGTVLWTPGSTKGSITGHDLRTGRTTTTVTTGAHCTPTDIQAVNSRLYWSCGASGPAGVYDRAAKRNIPVPAGPSPARLGDGFLVRENRTTHELVLTDVHTGTATTRVVAVLPATDQNTGAGNGRWAVDRFGGQIAYLGATYGQVWLVPSGVPTSPLAQMDVQVYSPSVITRSAPWSPVWQLNKPSTWTLTLATPSGTVRRTLTGAATGAAVRPAWDGTTDSGAAAPTGTYTWKLTARPRDGQGRTLTLTGTITLG
ncbi:FlgD immunoglobulin-like domain containing protein [Streptomyces sp. NPDC058464]|uniref:FlgD immunoglobulin-like domain containing protein n=1 Tax=Streptomyces sp. NPDC058464 TaxID=3346511 RepID=UPI00365B1157